VREFPAVAGAECYLVSQIGRPIDDPEIAELRVSLREPGRTAPPGLDNAVRDHLAELPHLWRRMLTGEIAIDRWPMQRRPGA
jgi:S-adenosylmethionine synthetase